MNTIIQIPSTASTVHGTDERHLRRVRRAIRRRSFATLATTSPLGRPHVAGVVYVQIGDHLWIHTDRSSRKGRNLVANRHVALCIPFRRLPVGPPFTIHFQGTADLVPMDDPDVLALLAAGHLDKIAGHGALDMPDGCFVRIHPGDRVHTFGYGVPPLDMARHPLEGGRSVRIGGRS